MTIPKLLPDDPQAAYGAVAEAVRNIEEAGFDAIWIPDVLNRGYLTFDPLIYAAVVASLSRVREIGTAVLQVGRHDAVDLAHRVLATVLLSDGRFTLGAGAGSTRGDFDAVARPFENRFEAFDRNLQVMGHLLDGGAYGDVRLLPEGSASMMPPVIIGSWRSRRWIERAAHDFDGWMGSTAKSTLSTLIDRLDLYRSLGGQRAIAGNLYVDLNVMAGRAETDRPLDLRCSPREASDRIKRLADAGFDEATLTVFDHTPRHLEMLRQLT